MPKTERIYYSEPYLFEFEAAVIDDLSLNGRHGIVLDRTAFYPTSGGQPNDLGTLNGVEVLDCYEDEATGRVIHVLDRGLSSTHAHGIVDAARRRDHVQQHSGQHVLSQAFVELFGFPTVSFHLGAASSTIDLGVESITKEQASQAEDRANQVIAENRLVQVCYIDAENVAQAGLRKPTERTGEIRVIDIDGFDKSACGGTHVRRTSEIGSIVITGIERMKKQARVEFICGFRVARYAREATRTLDTISQRVSAPRMASDAAVKSVWDELQRSRKRLAEQDSKLVEYEAREFPVHDGVAVGAFKGRDIEAVKQLAHRICLRPSVVALLADESDQIRVVFMRSADSSVDVAAILKKTIEKFGGRGGGKPSIAQGGGFNAESASQILEYARSLI